MSKYPAVVLGIAGKRKALEERDGEKIFVISRIQHMIYLISEKSTISIKLSNKMPDLFGRQFC